MPITANQLKKYRYVWGRVRKALVDYGEFSPADAEAERKAIHREAINSEKSSKDFTNSELNRVLDAFDQILVILDGPSAGKQSRNAASLIWAIDQLGLDEPYIAAIAYDQFKTRDWRSLPESRLTIFRYTLTRAASARRKS